MKILENAKRFNTYPNSLKNGIILLYAGWIWYLLVLYLFFFQGSIPPRQFLSGFIACTCIFTLQKWARALCILVNVFVIIQILPASISLFQVGNSQMGLYLVIAVILFAASSFFLFIKPTADFFNKIHEDGKKEHASKFEK